MTDPVNEEADAAQQRPSESGVAQPSIVAWDEAPPTSAGPDSAGQRRLLDVVVSVVALAALVFFSLIRAASSGTTGSERLGYVIGGVAIALLISAAARWLWVRTRRRSDPTARLLSPWIPIGAVIVVVLSIFGGKQA
jgi:uncharacterized membrane protein YidH (DUF202 family)